MSDPATGFLEEAPGVKSATRLTAIATCLGINAVILTICVYVLLCTHKSLRADAGVIAALATPLVPLAGAMWAALKERA